MKEIKIKYTVFTYITGFGLSLVLTLLAYLLVQKHIHSHHLNPSDTFMLVAVSVLAVTQLLVQLVFFLHLDNEKRPWWNSIALLFAVMVVVIIVFGSLWIMQNLSYHHGPVDITHDGHHLGSPQQTNQYIIHDEGIQP
ncbi:MAG TPA: cytochrome o ubiquinol oxidase subunit IV [Candidatus Babeliales bacterium]|nr:cytochrome o ubiquinol oxidase subunit IV [Candidatus Babeliales bacterium]